MTMPDNRRPLPIVVLSEVSLPMVLWLAARGRCPCILGVASVLPGTASLLERVRTWLLSSKRACGAEQASPEIARHIGLDHFANTWVDYARLKPWIDLRYAFSGPEDFRLAAKLAIWNHLLRCFGWLAAIEQLVAERGERAVTLVGVGPETHALLAVRRGETVPYSPFAWWWPVMNVAVALAVMTAAIGFVLRRLSSNPTPPVEGKVASNLFQDSQLAMMRQIVHDDQLMVLYPQGLSLASNWLNTDGIRLRRSTDFKVKPGLGLGALGRALANMAVLAMGALGRHPALFQRIVTLGMKRMRHRLNFHDAKVKAFFAWDEYSEDHILRTAELRRHGILSLGQVHGVPCTQRFDITGYLDFDICYVMSANPFIRDYAPTWGAGTQARTIPTAGLTAGRRALLPGRVSRDIAIYLNCATFEEGKIALILALARRFTDRTIYVKIKKQKKFHDCCSVIVANTQNAEPNIRYTDEDSYDLMTRIGYSITDFSTIAIEAMHFGLPSFVIDFAPQVPNLCYRDFSGCAVESPEDMIARIQSMEDGTWQVPWEEWRGLMDLAGECRAEVMRWDIDAASAI